MFTGVCNGVTMVNVIGIKVNGHLFNLGATHLRLHTVDELLENVFRYRDLAFPVFDRKTPYSIKVYARFENGFFLLRGYIRGINARTAEVYFKGIKLNK